nr:ROK family protein [Angustibacter aerolatus]
MSGHVALGVDVGGSGVKGAPVDLRTGELIEDRVRLETPQPATPEAVADTVKQVADGFGHHLGDGTVGITVPGVVTEGVVRSAANIDRSWIGTDADALMTERLAHATHVVNDADAAGVAEARYGAARGTRGLVLMTTLGTGIGTALLLDGRLVPNSEPGPPGRRRPRRRVAGRLVGARARGACRGRRGPSGCSATTACSRTCSGRRSSSSGAASARRPTSSCRCCTFGRRSCRPRCATPRASSVPRCWRTSRGRSADPSGQRARAAARTFFGTERSTAYSRFDSRSA